MTALTEVRRPKSRNGETEPSTAPGRGHCCPPRASGVLPSIANRSHHTFSSFSFLYPRPPLRDPILSTSDFDFDFGLSSSSSSSSFHLRRASLPVRCATLST